MKSSNNILLIRQIDEKIINFRNLPDVSSSKEGWIGLLRKTLKMSLRQLGQRMKITPQSVRDLERREREGSITIKALREAGEAFGMKLIYGFVPVAGSLESMVEARAYLIARNIVLRTSTSMKLEDQENSNKRIDEAIKELTEELKRELPKSLWD